VTGGRARVLRPGEAPSVQIGGLGAVHLVDAAATAGACTLVEHPLEARSLGSPIHTHRHEDELTYVLEGRIGLLLGDEEIEATPGTLVHKPRDVPHAFWNATDEPARLLELIVPAGFERFFDEIAVLFPEDREPTDEELARFAEISDRYGLVMDLESIPRLMERHGLLRA
jgi:mannose-6-phosphate isomerase-like protein (cupin superfamily)